MVVGLPDTIWFPEDGAGAACRDDRFSFLLFPVERPELFDAVVTDAAGRVLADRGEAQRRASRWVWGAFKLPGRLLHELHELWRRPDRGDEYIGTLVNAWLATGGAAQAAHTGEVYVDVGTLHGYREAVSLLAARPGPANSAVVPFRVLQQRSATARRADQPGAAGALAGG